MKIKDRITKRVNKVKNFFGLGFSVEFTSSMDDNEFVSKNHSVYKQAIVKVIFFNRVINIFIKGKKIREI